MKLLRTIVHKPEMMVTPKRSGMGVGTALRKGIKKVVQSSPLPESTKKRILECDGCEARADFLDKHLPRLPIKEDTDHA